MANALATTLDVESLDIPEVVRLVDDDALDLAVKVGGVKAAGIWSVQLDVLAAVHQYQHTAMDSDCSKLED